MTKSGPSPAWIVVALMVVAVLAALAYRPDRPVDTIAPGSSSGPAFVVQVIRPRAGLPLGGILPPDIFGLEEHLGFDSSSPGATTGRFDRDRPDQTRLEFAADGWNLTVVLDAEGHMTSETRLTFALTFQDQLRTVRCRPDDLAVGTFALTRSTESGDVSGHFDIELAHCEDAVTGAPLGWPPQPLVLRGSFDQIPPSSTERPAAAADFVLTFSDEFSGTELDMAKWQHRSLGPRKQGVVVEGASTLDGDGHLVMTLSQVGEQFHIAQIATQRSFLQKYGYFECRARVNHELGAHTAFWLQSPALGQGLDDPARFGTEIDIFEYHIAQGRHWVFHNLHWNGYGDEHQQAGMRVQVAGIDEGFHTFGLLWTEEEYVFYVDGRETWRTGEAVSQIAEYLILSVELSGWGGDVSEAELPDEILFDYVRVYQAP